MSLGMRPHHTFLLQKPLKQYLQEQIHHLRMEDRLLKYIPFSILIQHYVYFRIALRRYVTWYKSRRPLNFIISIYIYIYIYWYLYWVPKVAYRLQVGTDSEATGESRGRYSRH